MSYIIGIVVVLGVLIFFHELGHFICAKAFGVGVEKFSLGFGPKILSKTIGKTEYRLSAIPLGGYVKMVGEQPDEEIDLPRILPSTWNLFPNLRFKKYPNGRLPMPSAQPFQEQHAKSPYMQTRKRGSPWRPRNLSPHPLNPTFPNRTPLKWDTICSDKKP